MGRTSLSLNTQSKEEFWKKRRLKVYSRDEYGNEFSYICSLPVFFHNRLSARLEIVELIDEKENVIQTIVEDKKKIDTHNEFHKILTTKELGGFD